MKSNINIAFFLQDLEEGGAERAIVSLAGEIEKNGFEVDLVVGDADSNYLSEISDKLVLSNFGTRSPLKVLIGLISYLRRKKPSVIMSALDIGNIILFIAVKLSGYKGRVIVSQRAVIEASQNELPFIRRFLTRWLQRICFLQADAVISNSYAASNDVKNLLCISEDRIFTIHNALDIDRIKRFSKKKLDDPWLLNNKAPLIVSVGSFTPRKDFETLIKAFAIVRSHIDVCLVIIGKELESAPGVRQKLENMVDRLGISESVYLPGFDANPFKWLAKASVFVSSSIAEGFPNVIAEALALNCPIVATDCPGDTAEILGNGKWGRLVPVGDSNSMANAIIATMNDFKHPNGFVRAADFSLLVNMRRHLDVLVPEFEQMFLDK